jgi:hypothetical protein
MNATCYPGIRSSVSPPVRHELVARRAYEKWVSRGCLTGTAVRDWREAEAEVDEEIRSRESEHALLWPHLSDGSY